MGNAFATTLGLFRSNVNYTRPLSYEEWLALPEDHKAAVLYCQFYEQITLAWYKVVSVYSNDEDGVDEVCQYLMKNVEKINGNPKKFTPAYIYKVAYNCLYCLCRDPNRYKRTYENECSNIFGSGDDEFDIFDTVGTDGSEFTRDAKDIQREKFWKIIESKGKETILVVAELLGETFNWTETTTKKDGSSAFKTISKKDMAKITEEQKARIIEDLQNELIEFYYVFS